MNEIKQYAQEQMKEFCSLKKPSSYKDSFYGEIKSVKDVEFQFEYAENFISSCEKEENACRIPGYEEQNLVVYKVIRCSW